MQITGEFENEHLICNEMERLYLFGNSTQISAQTGFQGYMRGDFDRGGDKFFSSFFPFKKPFEDGFDEALDAVMNTLREGILSSYSAMKSFCYGDGYDGKLPHELRFDNEFAFRLDNKNFAFFFRLVPRLGDYHVYCFCYRKDWLEQHMANAERGIRFIDSRYNQLFRLKDGGKIRIEGKEATVTCRYIDAYHVEIGNNLYHIAEYADRCEQCGYTVKPAQPEDELR